MSSTRAFTVTWSERIHAQAEVTACCIEHAKDKAARVLHQAVFDRMADCMDGEILEFEGPDSIEAEEDEQVSRKDPC